MHSSLRPGLRGAHRILQSTSIRSPHSTNSRLTIRSFSSYQRLRSQSPPAGSPKKPSENGSDGGDKSPQNDKQKMFEEFMRSFMKEGPFRLNESKNEDGSARFPEKIPRESVPPDMLENVDVTSSMERGEIPAGYKIIEQMKDVPASLIEAGAALPEPPFLLADDFKEEVRIIMVPKEMLAKLKSKSSTETTGTSNSTESTPQQDTEEPSSPTFYGSNSARKRRTRGQKQRASASELMPKWFLDNNVTLSALKEEYTPGVLAIKQIPDGSYVPASAEQDSVEAVKAEESQTNSAEDREFLKLAQGHGGKRPKPDDEARSSVPVPTHDVQNHVALSNKRYFIEQQQYRELLSTFKGRLTSPAPDSTLKNSGLALQHLTINHSAKNSDLLLDALVSDLCHEAGADKIRLDIQDISELIAKADVDSSLAENGGRLSFRIYKDMYEPHKSDSSLASEFDDEDMQFDDDSSPPEFPAGLPGQFSGGTARDLFKNLTKSLNKGSSPLIEFIASPADHNSDSSMPSPGMFGSLVESILASDQQARKQNQNDPSEDSNRAQSEQQQDDMRPLVIHMPNYRALQDHALSRGFLGEMLMHAERQPRRVMIVGTDCVRDEDTHRAVQLDPSFILTEQNNKSYGASTNILLTPVFPNIDAEMALLQDRDHRIRNINARHLALVLQAKGIQLKGLEPGFWSKDYSKDLSQRDWNRLSYWYWPFLDVQRLAALIIGEHPSSSASPISDALEVMIRSDKSKHAWASRNQPTSQVLQASEMEQPVNKTLAKIRSKASRHEKKLLSGVVESNKINTTFKDIHIPAETIEALQNLTTLSLVRPEAFRYGVLKSDRIPGLLLYGPPGTGKTLAAKAVAKESGATMLEVSGADLKDMYVGEGEKNVQALFSLAKKLSPCVVFLDEADAMFSARSGQGRHANHRELLNQFLKEWDGMSNDSGSAFIMVATNRPMDLDDAVLRRLPRRLLVDLPTENDRLEILRIHLRQEILGEDVNLPDIAKKTPFYSGSDLKNVAVAAALNAVRDENEAAKQYRLNSPDAEKPYQYPEKRVLTMTHFNKALEEISASISEDMSSLKEIKKFDEQYGDRKGRKKRGPKWGFKSSTEADKVSDTVKVRS